MEVHSYLTQKEQIRDCILEYIDRESDNDDENAFTQLKEIINQEQLSRYDLKEFLHLILSISNNHHRNPYFFERIKQILFLIKDQIKQNISIPELFELFSTNKRLQLILFELEILSIQDPIIEALFKRSISNYAIFNKQKESNDTFAEHNQYKRGAMMISPTNKNDKSYKNNENLLCYFYPEIESMFDQITKEILFQKITQFSEYSEFLKNREIGENDSIICTLIRNDLIDDFVPYVSKKNYPLSSSIVPSIFETNEFLIQNSNKTSLIEYAAFNGSIQIFNYLRLNNVELNPSLWLYSIHGKNAEIIHLLEENKVEPPNDSFILCLIEAIKCHHDDIADYIQEQYSDLIKNDDTKMKKSIDIELPEPIFIPMGNIMINHMHHGNNLNHRNHRNHGNILTHRNHGNILTHRNHGNTLNHRNHGNNLTHRNHGNTLNHRNHGNTLNHGNNLIHGNNLNLFTVNFMDDFNDFNDIDADDFKNSKIIRNTSYYSFKYHNYKFILNYFKNDNSNLFNACKYGYYPIVNFLLSQEKNDATNDNNDEPLNVKNLLKIAAKNNNVDIIYLLLSKFDVSIEDKCFEKCKKLTKIIIPNSKDKIGNRSFEECESLIEVQFPSSSITRILNNAFDKCYLLNEIIIPSSVKELGKYCFNQCKSLKNVQILGSITELQQSTFDGCSSLIKIELPSTLKKIGSYCFNLCSSLIEIIIPSSVIEIEKSAFSDCSSLKKIEISNSLKEIKDNLFYNCTALIDIKIPSSVLKIEKKCFQSMFFIKTNFYS